LERNEIHPNFAPMSKVKKNKVGRPKTSAPTSSYGFQFMKVGKSIIIDKSERSISPLLSYIKGKYEGWAFSVTGVGENKCKVTCISRPKA